MWCFPICGKPCGCSVPAASRDCSSTRPAQIHSPRLHHLGRSSRQRRRRNPWLHPRTRHRTPGAHTGIDSQYMWTTLAQTCNSHRRTTKRAPCRASARSFRKRLLRASRPCPATGRLACLAASVENLPEGCDLNSLAAFIDDAPDRVCYVGPRANATVSPRSTYFCPKARAPAFSRCASNGVAHYLPPTNSCVSSDPDHPCHASTR